MSTEIWISDPSVMTKDEILTAESDAHLCTRSTGGPENAKNYINKMEQEGGEGNKFPLEILKELPLEHLAFMDQAVPVGGLVDIKNIGDLVARINLMKEHEQSSDSEKGGGRVQQFVSNFSLEVLSQMPQGIRVTGPNLTNIETIGELVSEMKKIKNIVVEMPSSININFDGILPSDENDQCNMVEIPGLNLEQTRTPVDESFRVMEYVNRYRTRSN